MKILLLLPLLLSLLLYKGTPVIGTPNPEEDTYIHMFSTLMKDVVRTTKDIQDTLVALTTKMDETDARLTGNMATILNAVTEEGANAKLDDIRKKMEEYVLQDRSPDPCNGVIVKESGSLAFFPTNIFTRRCIWTIQAGSFERIRVTLEQENFSVSNASIRITPMWTFREHNITSFHQQIWGPGSQGSHRTFLGPVMFVELLPGTQGPGGKLPTFHLRFRGTGNRTAYSHLNFNHTFHTEQGGSIDHREYGNNEALSAVILPKWAGGNVSLTEIRLDIDDRSCLGDYVQLLKIGGNMRWGHVPKYGRNCSPAPLINTAMDEVGMIVMFFSDESRNAGGFSYRYDID